MDPACPTAECIAGDQSIATGEVTFFGNKTGNAGKSVWPQRKRRLQRGYRQAPHGYGHPA